MGFSKQVLGIWLKGLERGGWRVVGDGLGRGLGRVWQGVVEGLALYTSETQLKRKNITIEQKILNILEVILDIIIFTTCSKINSQQLMLCKFGVFQALGKQPDIRCPDLHCEDINSLTITDVKPHYIRRDSIDLENNVMQCNYYQSNGHVPYPAPPHTLPMPFPLIPPLPQEHLNRPQTPPPKDTNRNSHPFANTTPGENYPLDSARTVRAHILHMDVWNRSCVLQSFSTEKTVDSLCD